MTRPKQTVLVYERRNARFLKQKQKNYNVIEKVKNVQFDFISWAIVKLEWVLSGVCPIENEICLRSTKKYWNAFNYFHFLPIDGSFSCVYLFMYKQSGNACLIKLEDLKSHLLLPKQYVANVSSFKNIYICFAQNVQSYYIV